MFVPGAELLKISGETFEARMAVALGPIHTTFGGHGTFVADAAKRECRIEGRGQDRGGPSSARGAMVCRLFEEGSTATRIEATIDYALTGPLAQLGRPSLVVAMVATLGADFAENMNAQLLGHECDASQLPAGRAIDDFRLLAALVSNRLRRLSVFRS